MSYNTVRSDALRVGMTVACEQSIEACGHVETSGNSTLDVHAGKLKTRKFNPGNTILPSAPPPLHRPLYIAKQLSKLLHLVAWAVPCAPCPRQARWPMGALVGGRLGSGLAVGTQWGRVLGAADMLCVRGQQSSGHVSLPCLKRKQRRQGAKHSERGPLTSRASLMARRGRSRERLPTVFADRHGADNVYSRASEDSLSDDLGSASAILETLAPKNKRKKAIRIHSTTAAQNHAGTANAQGAPQGREPCSPVPQDCGEKGQRPMIRPFATVGPKCSRLTRGRSGTPPPCARTVRAMSLLCTCCNLSA